MAAGTKGIGFAAGSAASAIDPSSARASSRTTSMPPVLRPSEKATISQALPATGSAPAMVPVHGVPGTGVTARPTMTAPSATSAERSHDWAIAYPGTPLKGGNHVPTSCTTVPVVATASTSAPPSLIDPEAR